MREIYLDNDNVVEIDELRDVALGTYLNAATVGMRILTTGGAEVVASQSMSYVGSSNGKYRVSLDKALVASLTEQERYDLEITAVEAGLDYRRLYRVRFVKRRDT